MLAMPMSPTNGKVRIDFLIPEELHNLMLRIAAREQAKRGFWINRHTLLRDALIAYARQRRIPIPKGL